MDSAELMTPSAKVDLAAQIEKDVRAVAGVRNVYRSGSLISNLLRAGAAAIGTQEESEPLVSVLPGEQGVAVEASIGIDFRSRAADTLRGVHEAVDARLRTEGLRRDSITLTVVYVQSPEST